MQVIAKARFIRTAPDKIRLLKAIIFRKTIEEALAQLRFSNKNAAKSLTLILKQASAQIKDKNGEINTFRVDELRVDEGPKLKRRRIRHQGRATAILKRMSHITLVLSDGAGEKAIHGRKFAKNEKNEKHKKEVNSEK